MVILIKIKTLLFNFKIIHLAFTSLKIHLICKETNENIHANVYMVSLRVARQYEWR